MVVDVDEKYPLLSKDLCLRLGVFAVRRIQDDNVPCKPLERFPSLQEPEDVESASETVCLVLQDSPVTAADIGAALSEDEDFVAVRACLENGFSKDKCPAAFWTIRRELWLSEKGLLMIGSRIIVPTSLRKKILMQAHEGHIGAEKMKILLRSMFYWPKMTQDIDDFVRICEPCIQNKPQNFTAPMKAVADETREPWHTIAIDFTGSSSRMHHKIYFTVIDHFSRYPIVYEVKSSSSEEAVRCLSHLFSLFGIPRVVISDNGSAFTSGSFQDFLRKCQVEHKRSSPYYPQSNSVIERLHGTFKSRVDRLLSAGVRLDVAVRQALFDIRSLPNVSTGVSPFQRFFGREMPSRWVDFQTTSLTCPRRDLGTKYEKYRKNKKVLHFDSGQSVLLRDPRSGKFTIGAHILRRKGYGSWLVNADGKYRIVNQRFIRKNPNPSSVRHDSFEPGWPDEEDGELEK